MARVAVTSCMYLGDVAPFITVARRLSEAGHDVTFIAPAGFSSFLEPEPFTHHCYALDASPRSFDMDPVHTRLMRHPFANASRLAAYWMDRGFADDPGAAASSLREGMDGIDVVVTHPTMASVALPVARSMGASVVTGHLFPMMIPTGSWTMPLYSRSFHLSAPLNRATWHALRTMTTVMFRDREINELRRTCGLEPLRGNAGWAWIESDETVVLTSRHYSGDAAPDWPPVRWGGFSTWSGPHADELDPELRDFIDAGDPPVVVTLGTSASAGAGPTFARIAEQLDAAGLRSILLVGHESNLASVPNHPAAVTFAPLGALLPHCSVAVVSGALGGLAAALCAGVPTVVHPRLFDQLWHGRRVAELGVGLNARRGDDIAPAAVRVAGDPTFASCATALAEQMADEDGPGAIVSSVERVLEGRR